MSNFVIQKTNHDPKRTAGGRSPAAVLNGDASSDGAQRAAAEDTSAKALLWMFRFLLPVKREAALAMLYLSVGIGFEIFTTDWIRRSIDQIRALHQSDAMTRLGFLRWFFSADPSATALRHVNATLMTIAAGLWLFKYLREVSGSKLSMRMVYHLREAIYDKLQRVGFGFHDQVTSGQLINRALTDLQYCRQFLQTSVITVLDIVLVVGGYVLYLGMRNPWLALLSVVPLPIWTWYILRFSKRVQPVSKTIMEADDRNVSVITENIAGVHVVKAFATEEQEERKYNANCDDFFNKVLSRIRLYADFTPVIRTIGILSNLSLVLAVAVMVIVWGKLGIGDVVIIGIALNAILSRLQQVSAINEQYQLAVVSARRLLEVLKADSTVPENGDAKPLPPGPGAVRFENVTFGYDPHKPVLKNVTFEVKGGTNVAIVGPTGAGKSSLVSLISRFYDPQEGRITIDGMDIRDAALSSVRTQVALVFQETYLFSDTVEANIAYGRPNVRGGEVEAAARLAQAHEFIEKLAHGYQTLLGERGSSLSGGQKQRLAIARAILFNPRVLVLDDATAAVDPETEDLIRRGMKAVLRDRTVFTIAHRISTVKRADLVIVIEDGRITQMGTHKQLMAEDGHYREIAVVQLYGEEEHAARAKKKAEKPSHMDRVQNERELAAAQSAAKEAARPVVNSEDIR